MVNMHRRTDGTWHAARILDFPEAVLAGAHLVISATYNPIVWGVRRPTIAEVEGFPGL
jgi:hypothetical protein